MHLAVGLFCLVAVATTGATVARRLKLSEPLLLTIVGVIGSYLPFVPDVNLTPEVVLVGLLPPLLYTAAIRTSLIDFKVNRVAIGFLSVGLVIASTFAVALVTWWILPVPFAVAVAMGAIVAPPDAVATTAVGKRIGMPRRLTTILEGESLFNDATALVSLRTAIAAMAGSVSVWSVAGDFLRASIGGAIVGVVVSVLFGQIRRHIKDTTTDTAMSLLAPFAAFIPAEELHTSGVIAVVVCGLLLGHTAQVWQTASSRIAARTNWRTIEFILENVVFLLIGLQASTIVEEAWRSDVEHSTLVFACGAVLVATMVVRAAWIFPFTALPHALGRAIDNHFDWRYPAVASWAGMRGAVTLAAAFILPADTPLRPVLVLMALVVVAGTLLIQGTTLAPLVRLLRLHGPSRAEDALQIAGVMQRAAEAGMRALDEQARNEVIPDGLLYSLRTRVDGRTQALWERLGPSETENLTPSEHYRRLRMQMLEAERLEVLKLRDGGTVDHEVLQVVLSMLDLEESMIDRLDEADEELRQEETLVATVRNVTCEHLDEAPVTCVPDNPRGCQECVDEGLVWVHLRMCLTCGHIACCDSSPGNHATRHFRTTQHPVMRSFEAGEGWRWCYVDSLLG